MDARALRITASGFTNPPVANMSMHVAFLMQDTGALYGAERATVDLAEGLKCTGALDVSLMLIRETRLGMKHSCLEDAALNAGVPCTLFPIRGRCSWSLVRAIREHLRQQAIDVLHVVGYKAAVHGGLAVRFGRRMPWVSTIHGWLGKPHLKERFYDWTELQTIKRAQHVVVLSKYYRDRLIGRGVRQERIRWIPSGIQMHTLDVDQDCPPFAQNGSPPTIGILGRLSSEKNHAMFLHVAHQLLQEGTRARFLVAGDGPERLSIEKMVRELGLESQVVVAGIMDRTDFFRQTDCLALCSRIENLPYVILEAMAWSRPVVATCVGGVPDLVIPDENGILVDDQDVAGMAKAIRRLLSDTQHASMMGRAGRQRLETAFTLARAADAHVHMYRDLLGSRVNPCTTASD